MNQKRRYTAGLFIGLALALPNAISAAQEFVNYCQTWPGTDCEVTTNSCEGSKSFSISPFATHTYRGVCGEFDEYWDWIFGVFRHTDHCGRDATASVTVVITGTKASTTCTPGRIGVLDDDYYMEGAYGMQCTNWSTKSDGTALDVTCAWSIDQ